MPWELALRQIYYMSDLPSKLHRALNRELIKRLLIQYFTLKGYEDFKMPVSPPDVQDIVAIPQLNSKIEVVPYIVDLDVNTGRCKLGWNLFVLGTKRLNLGQSSHNNLAEIQTNVRSAAPVGSTFVNITPKEIITFVVDTLSGNFGGDITDAPQQIVSQPVAPMIGDHSGYYRKSQRPVF
jgi:hypothetical protein